MMMRETGPTPAICNQGNFKTYIGGLQMGHVFISPLNWGLGHASRDIPVIEELLHRGHEVTIGACGNAFAFLKREFPSCNFIYFEDYPQPYNNGLLFITTFTRHMPKLVRAFEEERNACKKFFLKTPYDLIISDSRPGVFSESVPSIQITHQVHQSLPLLIWPLELLGVFINSNAFKKYAAIVVPDNDPGEGALGGKLSRTFFDSAREKLYYSGILASVRRRPIPRDIDYLVVISGMEPQRTQLEKLVLPRVAHLPGKKVILLGKPQVNQVTKSGDDTIIYSYLSNEEKSLLMSRTKFIISRSGYTTMMDVAETGIRHGLFIPTPGQWEQEYLASYYESQGWFYSKSQFLFNLDRDMEKSYRYGGFPTMPTTRENVSRLYQELLAQHLE